MFKLLLVIYADCNYEGRENGGNCSSVHPVKGCEDDYDSTSSFEFHKGERSSMQQHSRSFSRPMSSKWNDAEKWIINRQPNYHSNKIQLHNRGATTSMVEKVDFAPETKDLTEVDSSCLTEDITGTSWILINCLNLMDSFYTFIWGSMNYCLLQLKY